jgi:hypothetical protein
MTIAQNRDIFLQDLFSMDDTASTSIRGAIPTALENSARRAPCFSSRSQAMILPQCTHQTGVLAKYQGE